MHQSRRLPVAVAAALLAGLGWADAGLVKAEPAGPLAAAQGSLALDLLAALGGDGSKNVAVSPSGLASVLGTLELGADKAMRAAIARTLQLGGGKGGDMADLREAMRLMAAVGAKPGAPLANADALFVDAKLPLKPGIADKAQAEGGAMVASVDFSAASGIETLNKWASDKTGGRIPTILDPGMSAELVAVNAMAFKDRWRIPFEAEGTSPAPFTKLDGSTAQTPMMRLTGPGLKASISGRFAAVELPYADARFAMRLVTTTEKPAAPKDFAKAEALVSEPLGPVTAALTLPKFAMKADMELLDTLADLGLKSGLASPGQLSGFADGLRLTLVRQKVMITVDEAGTEAAAVTAGVATRGTPAPDTLTLRFDKPFIYALRHVPTGAVLMAGYIADPSVLTGAN